MPPSILTEQKKRTVIGNKKLYLASDFLIYLESYQMPSSILILWRLLVQEMLLSYLSMKDRGNLFHVCRRFVSVYSYVSRSFTSL